MLFLFVIILFLFIFVHTQPPFLMSYSDSLSPRLPPVDPTLSVQIVQDSKDTVHNSYAPPLRYNENTYSQLGYLSSLSHSTKIILFGKPAHYGRDKWYYYTIINDIKLPVEINKRKCTVQPGCDSVSTKDKVIVDGQEYTVHLYETDF